MSLTEDIIFRHTKQHISNNSIQQKTPHTLSEGRQIETLSADQAFSAAIFALYCKH